MQIQKITPYLGANIQDIDLCSPVRSQSAALLRNALRTHGVLFFRDQDINSDALVELARIFGEPLRDSHPKFDSIDEHPEIAVVTNDENNPPDINVWHTDTTFSQVPAGVCVLKCVETPVVGGDTLWSSMYEAYDAISAGLRKTLLELDAEHRLPLGNVPIERIRNLGDREIRAIHPIVRWIPEHGRAALFVNRTYTRRIIGVHRLESEGLLNTLFNLAESPDFLLRFRWRRNSIAIWDNRITQHFATADYFPSRRTMHRIALAGEVPIAARDVS